MNLTEKQLATEYIYEGRIIKLRRDTAELPDGKTAFREVVEHNGGVCVVPITDDGKIILVEQYRYPYSEIIAEIPAGKRDSAEEEPLLTGKRELKEEVGASANNFIFLGELYPSPGYCGEIIWMYAATGLSFGDSCPDEDEFLNVKAYPLDDVVEKILSGKIKDAKTQAAVLKVKLLRDSGKLKKK